MKRILSLLWAALLTGAPLAAQYAGPSGYEDLYDSETVRCLKEHVRYLTGAELEGRKAGSEGERLSAEYVAGVLESYGVELFTPVSGSGFGVVTERGDTLTSLNVTGFIPGWDKELQNRYIVVGARLDSGGTDTYVQDGETVRRIYFGANGNASGVSLLLELARKLSTNRVLLRRSILLVGFGASAETFAGSWYFLNRAFPDAGNIDAMVNLDMLGTGDESFGAFTSGNTDLNAVVTALRGELLPVQAALLPEEPYPGDHRAFYDREIPSLLMTTGRYPEHETGRDTYSLLDFGSMERELEYLYALTGALANGRAPRFRPSDTPEEALAGIIAWSDADVKPAFLGSQDPKTFLTRWVYEYLRYPSYAVENGIQGTVMVDFVIDEKGNVTDVAVSRGVHTALDDEAVRVVTASPKWRPGRLRGSKVKVAVTLPVEFRLEKRKDGSFGINGVKIK